MGQTKRQPTKAPDHKHHLDVPKAQALLFANPIVKLGHQPERATTEHGSRNRKQVGRLVIALADTQDFPGLKRGKCQPR